MQQLTKLDSLWALSRSVKAEATLSRIMALCCDSTDTRFPFSVITFISSRESIGILSDWSADNIHCSGLHRLAQICWNDTDLGAQIRPFGPDQRVEKMFRMDMEEQYLASMAACRRALPADEAATWLQVLRLYVLVRALDALESSVTREAHLHDVCRTLRYVSETTGHERRAWIDKLAGSSTSFFEFESETLMRCRSALADTGEASARSFFNSLISILEHRPWSKLPVKSAVHGAGFDPYSTFHLNSDHFSHAQIGQELGLEGTEERDRPSADKSIQETDPAESDSKRRFNGEKLRLEMLEKYLFLPHSWHNISSDEEVFVFVRLKELLNADNKVDRFGAAVALLALLTGQSINDASKIRFGAESGIDWRLSVAGKSIHKLAPRFSKRWKAPPATSDHEQWVTPLSEVWEYKLMGIIAKPIFQALRNRPSAGDLDGVWQGLNPEATLANWFGAVFANSESLTRLSGPSTASRLSLKVFQQSQDHASARLLASDHRTALPSACAYGSYRGFEVARLLGGCLATDFAQMVLPPIDEQRNAAGSELDVNLPLLRRSIAGLTERVNKAARPELWCEHHNLLTALTVLALLSSTGTRPVNSPFQSLAWIDLERGLIYVQDKVAGPTQGSRICILSDFAKRLLRDIYLPHLERLFAALHGEAPKFSEEVERVLRSDPEAKLPLFFFLRQEPTFDWMEVSESQLDLTCRFNWSLPWNLFRHFSSTQLRRLGLHADIRDALLGHAERDAESHGDFSGRIPLEDFEVARPLVNRLQDDIGFTLPKDVPYPLHIDTPLRVEKEILQSTRPFGREARAIRRQKLHQAVQAIAKEEVLAFLGGRTVDQLSSGEFDQIGRQMLMRKLGLPHVMGSLRYEALESFLSSEWRAKGRHAKLRRRHVLIKEGRACFTEQALTAHQRLADFLAGFESLVQARTLTAERPVLAAALAAMDLVLYSGLTNFPMLSTLLCNGEGIQLVCFESRYWLEWGHGAPWQDGKPAVRIEVTDRAAHWISLAVKGKSSSAVPSLPAALDPLCARLNPKQHTLAELIRELVALQSQKNALGLRGFMAAYLSGRRPSSALPHADWIRIVKRAAPTFSGNMARSSGVDPTDGDMNVETFFRNHHAPASRGDEQAMDRCKVLFDQVKDLLKSGENNSRIAAQIARAVKTSGFARGDAPFMLCHFIVHVLKRKPKRGGREYLRANTAQRYWYSLENAFLSVAAGENWIDVEEDELTEWYEKIVAAMDPTAVRSDDLADYGAANTGDDEDSDESGSAGATDAPLRTLIQLREFHEFARSTYGLPDPDWSEISSDLTVGVGRPGMVSIEEYEAVLAKQLDGRRVSALDDLALSGAFVLLVCARFGLRLGEAVGLLRSEWLDIASSIMVLVASNSVRPLKTTHSKRKVPLIEALTAVELEVIQVVMNRWTHHQGVNPRSPLLAGISKETFRAQKAAIGSRLLTDIKDITGHEGSTLHTLRHGFAMRIFALLQGLIIHTGMTPSTAEPENARRLLLGGTQIDRRVLWAVARLLGHGGPGVTLRSYINCMHLWLPPIAHRPRPSGLLRPVNVIDLDRIEVNGDYLSHHLNVQDAVPELLEPTLVRAMRFLRLLAVGQTESSAGNNSKLTPVEVAALTSALNAASAKLTPIQNRYESYQILAAIPMPRFHHLLSLVENVKLPSLSCVAIQDWLDTVGPSRQIILFERHHFKYMAQFLTAMQLTEKDALLISKSTLHVELEKYAKAWKLEGFVKPKEFVSPTFQLDVARFGTPARVAPERVVVVVTRGGVLDNSYELLLLWILWKFSISSAPEDTTADEF